MRTEEFLEKKFREYYRQNSHRMEPPQKFEEREFGFAHFKDKMMVRHRHFDSISELRKFIEDTAPSDVYYSTAYYSNPEEEMEHKGWRGADLVFDIDADHIPTSCKELHDHWICKTCGRTGKGTAPQTCPSCNGERFNQNSWVCELCLRKARDEAMKLSEFLMEDYGFSEKHLRTFFTGHRGYHLHVMSDTILALDSDERKEIVDYVLGNGLDLEGIHILERDSSRPSLPEKSDRSKGWNRRILQRLFDLLANGDQNELVGTGFANTVTRTIIEMRGNIMGYEDARRMIENLDSHAVGNKRWERILRKIIEECSAKIDTVVTTDLHRLIRAKETLNGKTGLRTVEIGVGELESFDPFEKAIAFERGEETIDVEGVPRFSLGGSIFGPYDKGRLTLPTAAAVLLVCKGKAQPVIHDV